MDRRTLGSSGLQVSVVGLGCNNFGGRIDADASAQVIHRALDQGITLFDTADIYGNRGGSETILGTVLGSRRKDIVLATKFGMAMDDEGVKKGGSASYIVQAVEDSLRRLQTDWIDLYQMHEPDPSTPIEETLAALDQLVTSGKVRFIGCSNFPAPLVEESIAKSTESSWSAFVSCQDEYSLLKRDVEGELLATIRAHGLSLLPYFPLASGMLTGKYKRGEPLPEGTRFARSANLPDRYMNEKNWRIVEHGEEFAARHGKTVLDVAFAWLLAKPEVASVIAGATKPEQIDANVLAGGWRLRDEDVAEIDRAG